jgi:hypothetical protein
VQTKLQEQALALAARMDSRDLSSANEEFNSFGQDMQAAAAAMTPSADKLKQMQWHDAIPAEQKALQYLLRAEATFRKIEVAFGQQRGGGGGGGGGAGRDLASLFDLELDTEKNQYETAQTGSAADQRAKAVDDALQKLDAWRAARKSWPSSSAITRKPCRSAGSRRCCAVRPSSFSIRWSSWPRTISRDSKATGWPARTAGHTGQQASNKGNNQSQVALEWIIGGQSPVNRAGGSRAQSNADGGWGDPRVTQALNRLREADEEMKRSAGQQQSAEAARQAADQLRQAEAS